MAKAASQRPDQWHWQAVHRTWLDEIRDDNEALSQVIEATRLTQDDDTAAFLCFLGVRLLEMHRMLKPTGSVYLHCDHSTNGYIRMVMDAVFGKRNFRNEIAWRRTNSKNFGAKDFGRNHDTIFRYSKTNEATFNKDAVRTPYQPGEIPEGYRWSEEHQRYIALAPVHAPEERTGDSGKPATFRGKAYTPPPKGHWRVAGGKREGETTSEGWARLDAEGRMYLAPNGKYPMSIRFLDEMPGIALDDFWQDISIPGIQESTGSPDQKPLALYERIIRASSNEGDLVLDPFAGCATTPIAAHNLGRRWVGIDRREDAAFHITNRLLGLGINVDEFKARQQHLIPELQGQCEIKYEPPVRTDTGENAAPGLAPVYMATEKSTLTHREMKNFLTHTFGLQCWGCDFQAPDERYLQLDHVDPKADGGSNHLDNRALLCQPCNIAKSNRLTMSALRRENTRNGHLTRPPGTRRGDNGNPINLPQARQQCREELERVRMGMPPRTGRLL